MNDNIIIIDGKKYKIITVKRFNSDGIDEFYDIYELID